MRLCVTQRALQLSLFSSFCSSLQKIWTNWQKLLVELSKFVKVDECGLIQTHWRKIKLETFIPIWNFVCENIIMAEVSRHTSECYNYFSWCKLNLIHSAPDGRDLSKSFQCFLWWKLSLIHVTSIHSIRKSTKNRNSETQTKWNLRWKITGNSRPK